MLSICTDFAKHYNIGVIAEKTTGIKFGVPVTQQDCIYLNDNVVQRVDQVKHLGNIVHSNWSDLADCKLTVKLYKMLYSVE